MCSFIGLKCKPDAIKDTLLPIIELLDVKGGDEYNFVIKAGNFSARLTNEEIYKESCLIELQGKGFDEVIVELLGKKAKVLNPGATVDIIGFSRLTPEMEVSEKALSQPYHNTVDDTIIVVHGTIPKAEEIAARHGISIEVDTELFNYLPFDLVCNEVEKVGGKIAAMCVLPNGIVKHYHNGLGIYDFSHDNARFTTNIDVRNVAELMNSYFADFKLEKVHELPEHYGHPRIISLFSGGLDITCATQRLITDLEDNHEAIEAVELWYFDWGTVARDGEMEAGRYMANFISEEYDLPTQYKVIEVEPMFRNILQACDMTTTRLIDNDAEGAGDHEAEAAISYVPYRNTLLMTMAAARAEQLYPGEKCYFVIGANLSEGMIYLDNSETWVTAMNNLIKVGGQSSAHFEVKAPYVNRTKTEMVKDAMFKNFELKGSFSCYFPINGQPCGKCGSCLLRENALKRGLA